MEKQQLRSVISGERAALASDLKGISAPDWDRSSLCEQWTVRDVVAHIVATARITPATFFPKLAGSGFRLTRMQDKDIRSVRGVRPSDTLDALESVVDRRSGPPGPPETMLGETIVHSEDIRKPLGLSRDYPPDALVAVGDFYARSNLIIGGKRRVSGLTLRAVDSDWCIGSGPEVTGPLLALVMAVAGRAAAYRGELSGPGADQLVAV